MAAEMRALLQDLEDEVTCAICQDIFTTPKVLACLHAFCCECLNRFAKTHKEQQQRRNEHQPLRCPVCQEAIQVPDGGTFDELPTSFHHNSLAAILEIYNKPKGKATCESCENKQAGDFHCFECGSICDDCNKTHSAIKSLRNHKVLQTKDFNPQDIDDLKQKHAVCKEQYHNSDRLRYFCTQCQVCLCQVCITTDKKHKDHEINLMEQTADDFKRDISDCVEQISARQQVYLARIEDIKIARETLLTSTRNARATLRRTAERLITNILKQEEKTSDQLDLLATARDKELKEHENSAKAELRKGKETLEMANKVLDKGTAFEVFQAKGLIRNRVQELTRNTEHYKINVGKTFTFLPTDKDGEALYEEKADFLGVVLTSDRCEPGRSSVVLSCVESLETIQEANFVVELRSADGSLCHNPQDLKDMTVQIKALKYDVNVREGEEINCEVQERADGKYQIVFTPLYPGKYKVQVTIRGTHISNSPSTFAVKTRYFKNLRTIGNEMQFGGKPLNSPWGIAVNKLDFVAVCDTKNSRVLVLDDQLNYVREIGKKGSGDGEFEAPIGVTFDNNGDLVVADGSNSTVQVFKLTGEFIKKIGSEGQGDGQFESPCGVFVDQNNRLIVCDTSGVQVFDSNGNFQKKLKTLDNDVPVNCIMYNKLWVVCSETNGLYTCNDEGVTVSLLNSFKDIENFEESGLEVVSKPTAGLPFGLAVTRAGHLLVSDLIFERILCLSGPKGNVIAKYGDALDGNIEICGPTGIATFSDGRIIVSELGIDRIQILK